MKLIYLAGPITATSQDEWFENIVRARATAKELWRLDFSVICPHMNTAFMDGYASREQFIEGDKEQVRRCDAVVVLPNWEHSKGTWGEIEFARHQGKPVFFLPNGMAELLKWKDQSALAAKRAKDLSAFQAKPGLDLNTFAGIRIAEDSRVPIGSVYLANPSTADELKRRVRG